MCIKEETRDGIVILRISRPEKLNSLDTETLSKLTRSIRAHCKDEAVKMIVLTGEGKFFSSGIDLSEIASAQTPLQARESFERLGELLEALIKCSKPTATYLNGPAIAGGAEIALTTDIVIANPSSYISWPEIKWGIIAPMLAATLQSNRHQKLLEAALAGSRITPSEAIDLGIIQGTKKSLQDALEYLRETLETAFNNPEATKLYLKYWRSNLENSLNKINELVKLAENKELIDKARKFLSRKG